MYVWTLYIWSRGKEMGGAGSVARCEDRDGSEGMMIRERELMKSSCEDKDTIEPQITRGWKITMAAVREGVVCGVYDADYWQFVEGGDSYVPLSLTVPPQA
jgi:hypothetical protein